MPMYKRVFTDPSVTRTVVVVPSLSLDTAELQKIPGVEHYEERMLCMLMLLRMPRTHIVYVTSRPLPPAVVDYHLHLLPGVPVSHARRRLTLLSCDDRSAVPLTEKILYRPRLVERIRDAVVEPGSSHISCFNATERERTLSVRLGLPLYATDPLLAEHGTKSGSRRIFRSAGVPLPPGVEGVESDDDVVEGLVELKRRDPALRKALVKLDEGFSGEGNATFDFTGAPEPTDLRAWVRASLPAGLRFEAEDEEWEAYREKLRRMHGIVEAYIDGDGYASPSAQCNLDPLGGFEIVSTHDQVLGGPTGQIYLGCTFPADDMYRAEVQTAAERVGAELRSHGVIGRFGVDFVSVVEDGERRTYAIEINLRKGGTTLPYLTLQYLTGGAYDPKRGIHVTALGDPRAYYATDNLRREEYRRLTPRDLVDVVVEQGLHFDSTTQKGVVFHLIGAISEIGKLGVVSIGRTIDEASRHFERTVEVLDQETAAA